ncbi:copper chaperone PCu(A)C [Amorphus sp. 3PC139-8]|uniref:copper chaperone PCu(A)C n=1 Tax=Amorphus sp. 3PC139-8 TaxID=2735676 RepID=UPI00345D450E
MPRSSSLRRPLAIAALAAAAVSLTPLAATAHSYKLGDIAVGHIWAPPATPSDGEVPIYAPILNGTDHEVTLTGASTDIADEVRFQAVKDDGEVETFRSIALPRGRPTSLAAWSTHLSLDGLHKPLQTGDAFPLTLDFGPDGSLDVTVEVESQAGH